jgi:hypothetical protein
MAGHDDESGPETDDPAEVGAFHEAILARERAGGSFPGADALAAMEKPLYRLTSAAVLFTDVTTESTERAELRMHLSSTGGSDQ